MRDEDEPEVDLAVDGSRAFAAGDLEEVHVEDRRDADDPTVRRWLAELRRSHRDHDHD